MPLTVSVPMATARRAIPGVRSVITERLLDAQTGLPNNASAVSGMLPIIAMVRVVVRTTEVQTALHSPRRVGPIPARRRKVAVSTPTNPLALSVPPSTALAVAKNKTTPTAMEVVVARRVAAPPIVIPTLSHAVQVEIAPHRAAAMANGLS